jgi:hypothetical protein
MTQNRNLSILADNVSSAGVLNPSGGGTGITTTPANGQIPIGNGTNYTANQLSAGSNISITNSAGGIVIAATTQQAGSGPAFSVYSNASQTVTSATDTKVALNLENFDTNNNFDSTTNYRFTPTVAGYYQISGAIYGGSTSAIYAASAIIFKNGTPVAYGSSTVTSGAQSAQNSTVIYLVYMNGSTDYLELYGNVTGAGVTSIVGDPALTYMTGFLARIA